MQECFGLKSMDNAQDHLPCAKDPLFTRMKMTRSGLQTT